MFTLPDELPTTVAGLDQLRDQALRSINVIQARRDAGEELSRDDVSELRSLLEAVGTIDAARAEAAASETEVNDLLDQARAVTAAPEPEAAAEGDEAEGDEATDEAPSGEAPAAPAPAETVAAGTEAPVTFAGAGPTDVPEQERTPGWEMLPGAPNYREGRVGFRELALAIDSVTKGSRKARSGTAQARGSYFAQGIARLNRDVPLIEDSHALVAEIERVTRTLGGRPVTAEVLTAAGGWCAPSEQLYNFCDVPDAVDLVSLPELTINRGGIRWPNEPDISAILADFQFFFTEPQLIATDTDGVTPTAVKECVEIPCADEFTEIRLNAVGWCVEAGILQTQGWPELVEWFMRSLAAEHLRALSKRTILDMVADSTAITVTATDHIGAASSVLNVLSLQAVNLRLNKGLARNATIEGVAPSWFAEVLRADLAMQGGRDMLSVSDAEINGWLTARNIYLQYVGDWQTRDDGFPGDLGATPLVTWPATVKVLLYPAGTWFRSMSPVIEMGIMYPKEQLVLNRYTRFFTEDSYAVGKRCNKSLVVTIPLCVSGAIGARQTVTCNTPVV